MSNYIVEGRGIKKYFPVRRGPRYRSSTVWLKAVDGVDFTVASGETLGLVGESGCGKSSLSRILLMLDTATRGELLFDGKPLQTLSRDIVRSVRRSVQPVFQNPYSSLDPRMRIGRIIAEPLTVGGRMAAQDVAMRVSEVLELVGLLESDRTKFPHEFSGGQRQRIAIARAMASSPRLIVLDEAVSAQDISIRAQILNLLRDLQDSMSLSYLFIAHDLATVRFMSDRIGVMYLGKIVETGAAEDICRTPQHPYTKALFAATLPDRPCAEVAPVAIVEGDVPSPIDIPRGCRFHTRCPLARMKCRQVEPTLSAPQAGRQIACFLYDA